MRQKFVLGRYIERDSWVHRLDPRAKLTAMPLYVCILVFADSWIAAGIVTGFSFAVMRATNVPFRTFVKAAKPLRYLMIFMFVFQMLLIRDGPPLLDWGAFAIHAGGLRQAALSVWRMAFLVSFTAILTFTTTPAKLNQALEDVLAPFKLIRLDPQLIALTIGIALRFIPTIWDEAQTVIKAQASRGADLRELPWREKGKMIVPLLIPVIVGAFRRAEDLVYSMEARGFQLGQPRTKYYELQWKTRDSIFIASFALIGAVVFTIT